ncbi:MAG: aspartate/glutamate racemase family protein [Acidobacteriota bacterium]|nr:aspartate/glutamate racemase family protein [Acidobacteriota bacterium]
MHILITDSGVGGLSVCAYAEKFVRTHGFKEPVRLTFANAAPENDYGYNAMPSRDMKLQTFDRFLSSVTERYAPDFIYVACNTLSVLLPDTPYFHKAVIPVKGIVETGAELMVRELEADPRSVAIIFGTQTTIDAGAYPRLLEARGVGPSRIISQACPGLADTISEDREGVRTKSEIVGWVAAAIEKMQRTDRPVVACLACTHYGYRKDLFAGALADAGISARVVNPNERAVDALFGTRLDAGGGMNREVAVEFVTRYAIPKTTVEALTWFLSDISPRTVAAMKNFVHLPDLF